LTSARAIVAPFHGSPIVSARRLSASAPPATRSPLPRVAAAVAVHQQVSDRYRANYQAQVRRHEQQFAETPA